MWRRAGRLAVSATAFVLVAGLASPALSAPTTAADPFAGILSGRGHYLHRGAHGEADVNICSETVTAGYAHCDAHVRTDLFGKGAKPRGRVHAAGTAASPDVIGAGGAYDPLYLQSAYNAPSLGNGAGQTVAIVDAFDAVNAESDLAAYRSQFGLPACTTGNGCFRKVNQSGGGTYPTANAGWAEEISLDLDMVSAVCPKCHILLVEASSALMTDLGAAVNTAVSLGANVVSNSYGGADSSLDASYDATYYNHPGVAIVASSGDNGFGVSYPASSPYVVAVGGTHLVQTTNTGTRSATETVWSGAGSGCSQYEPKPVWQTDTGCAKRSVADVSAVADPSTGVWVYDSADGGWEVFGGTSVSAPIVGAMYALAGNATSTDNLGSYPYGDASALNDVTSGSNGSCGGSYLCTGAAGYDGPTGLGTPNTAAAFTAPAPGGIPPSPPPDSPPPQTSPPTPDPDFSISAAAPSAPLKAGASTKSTVTLTPVNGDTGTVNLSTTTTPNLGLTTTIAPHAVTLGATPVTSTLALTAHTGGTYTVTITATQGVLTHKTTVKVTVNDFSIDVSPAKASVVRGKSLRYTVTLTPDGSFTSPVTLSVSGLRTRDTVAYVRNPAAPSTSQTVTITTSTKDARGTLSLRFTGVGGTLTHNVAVTLVLQ